MPVDPHQPVSPIALIVAVPFPMGIVGGWGVTGGAFGSPLGEPAAAPLPAVWEADRDAEEGEVGDPPHHDDASAHATTSIEPTVRGEQGIK
jgi:hypothetical protein